MEAVILIHGITGSALSQQQGSDLVSIWPPDTSDLFGYSQAKFDILGLSVAPGTKRSRKSGYPRRWNA